MSLNTSSTPDKSGKWVVTEFGDPSVLKWENCSFDRDLTTDEVLVRVIATGVAGADNMQRVGGYPDPRTSKPGFTPGYDLVGEVVAVGPQSSSQNVAVGDIVVSMCVTGAHATHIYLPSEEVVRIDPRDDPVKIAALPLNYMTAWGMLRHSEAKLSPGSSILIGSASGGLGTAVAQLAQAFNMDLKMIGLCSQSKFGFLESLGVTPVDRTAPDVVSQVKRLTNGAGVDVAYDAVGSEESIRTSLEATKPGTGQVVVVGVLSEIMNEGDGLRAAEKFDLREIISTRLPPRSSFFNVIFGYYLPKRDIFWEDFMSIVSKVRSGELDPHVFRVLPLRDAVEAHRALVSGKDIKGKMVFAVDQKVAAEHGVL